MKGLLIILSAPSGGGKTTVIQKLKKQNPHNFEYSISATTRKPRQGEINNIDYIFVTEDEFQIMIDRDEFLEWERVHQYHYGTPKKIIEYWLQEGKKILLDVDVNGGLRIKQKYPDDSISIFLAPPSIDILIDRLKKRKTDSPEEIEKRLKRLPLEIEKKNQYDYIVVNENIDETVKNILSIIENH